MTTARDRTQATTMPSSIPSMSVATKATRKTTKSDLETRHSVAGVCTSRSLTTETMMVAASVTRGRVSNTEVMNKTTSMRMTPEMNDDSGVRDPAEPLTTVREKPPVTGTPLNMDAKTLATPMPYSSWLEEMGTGDGYLRAAANV